MSARRTTRADSSYPLLRVCTIVIRHKCGEPGILWYIVAAMTENLIRCGVGITAYNEEANIGRLLEAIADQLLDEVEITEIVVVASGCTDRTEEIVRDQMAREPRIQLYVQEQREGKTSAVNVFLAHAAEEICVLESGDTLPGEDTIERMVRMFRDPAVGMTGAHKVAVNTPLRTRGWCASPSRKCGERCE